MHGVQRTGANGGGDGGCWPSGPSGEGEVEEGLGDRDFPAHEPTLGHRNDKHPGGDIRRAQGATVVAPVNGSIVRSWQGFFGPWTDTQTALWTEVDPSSSLTVARSGTNLQLTCARVGVTAFPSAVARLVATSEKMAIASGDWVLEIELSVAPSLTGAIGIGVFNADLTERVALDYNGTLFTSYGVGTTTFTANGQTYPVAGKTWLRISYTLSTTTYRWSWSTNGVDWTDLATETGRAFASSVPEYTACIYWRSADTNATPYTVNIVSANFWDVSQTAASRFGNWLMFRRRDGRRWVIYHCQELLLRSGHVTAGQLVALAGKTGKDTTSGPVNAAHIHLEEHPDGSTTYSRSEAVSPFSTATGLPRVNVSNNVTAAVTDAASPLGTASWCLTVQEDISVAGGAPDVTRMSLTGNLATRTVDYNTNACLDPADLDAPYYDGVYRQATARGDGDPVERKFYFAKTTVGSSPSPTWSVKDADGTTVASG